MIHDDHDLPAPEQVLTAILARRNADRLSAHQIIEDSQAEVGSLARLGAVYEDATKRATEQWISELLADRGLAGATDDRQWPALIDRVRALIVGGYEVERLIPTTLDHWPIDDARSVAGILHWRLGTYTADLPAVRPLGPAAAIPPTGGPLIEVARQAADLMSQRWHDLRETLDSHPAPSWLDTLGPRPDDHTERSRWLNAATAVAAYRERFEVADHTSMLGPRPTGIRPDAQALYGHAQLTVDRYAARRLEHLHAASSADLQARQQAILDQRPHFDPAELERARRHLDDADRTWRTTTGTARASAERLRSHAQRHVDRLEARAEGPQALAMRGRSRRRHSAPDRRDPRTSSIPQCATLTGVERRPRWADDAGRYPTPRRSRPPDCRPGHRPEPWIATVHLPVLVDKMLVDGRGR